MRGAALSISIDSEYSQMYANIQTDNGGRKQCRPDTYKAINSPADGGRVRPRAEEGPRGNRPVADRSRR